MNDAAPHDLSELTVELLSSFVASNSVQSEDMLALIASTHAALTGLPAGGEPVKAAAETYMPAVPARKSLGKIRHLTESMASRTRA